MKGWAGVISRCRGEPLNIYVFVGVLWINIGVSRGWEGRGEGGGGADYIPWISTIPAHNVTGNHFKNTSFDVLLAQF